MSRNVNVITKKDLVNYPKVLIKPMILCAEFVGGDVLKGVLDTLDNYKINYVGIYDDPFKVYDENICVVLVDRLEYKKIRTILDKAGIQLSYDYF